MKTKLNSKLKNRNKLRKEKIRERKIKSLDKSNFKSKILKFLSNIGSRQIILLFFSILIACSILIPLKILIGKI